MFRNAISLKLVVRTYMGGSTPVYNGKKVLKVFFKTAIWLPYGQLWGQLHSPKVNHCVLHFRPESPREPRNEVGFLSPAECLVRLNQEPSDSYYKALTYQATLSNSSPWSFLIYNTSLTRSMKSRQYATQFPMGQILFHPFEILTSYYKLTLISF